MQKKILLMLTTIMTLLLLSCASAIVKDAIDMGGIGCSHTNTKTTYEKYNDSQHTVIKSCKSCGEELSSKRENHIMDNGKCYLCHYQKDVCSASKIKSGHNPVVREVISNSITHMNGQHPVTYYCSTCGVSFSKNENCNLVSEDGTYGSDGSYHWTAKICKACGYREQNGNKEAHQFGDWSTKTDKWHTRKCKICKKAESKEHTFVDKVCTVCGYQQDHIYGMDGRCVDCGKVVSFVGGAFLSISNWSAYTPGDPGISSWSDRTVTITIDGKWQSSGKSNITFDYQFYRAHNQAWHDGVAKLFLEDKGYTTSYTRHLEYMGEVYGGGSIAGTVSKGGNTISFNGVPTSGRVKASFSIYGTVKRYVNGDSVSNDPPPTESPKGTSGDKINQVTIKHVDLSTGDLMAGTKETTKDLPLKNEPSLTLSGPWEGYVNKGATLDGKKTENSKPYEDTTKVYKENVEDNGKNRELIFYYIKDDSDALILSTHWVDFEDRSEILPSETKGIEIGKSAQSYSKQDYIEPMGYKLLKVEMYVENDSTSSHTSEYPLPMYNVTAKKTGKFSISGKEVTTSKDLTIYFYYEKENDDEYTLTVKYQDEGGNPLAPDKTGKLPETPTTESAIPIPGYEFKESQKNAEPRTPSNTVTIGDVQEDTVVLFVYKKPKSGDNMTDDLIEIPANGNSKALLRSNDRDNEEYNVEVAIPTSEDLYTNILTDGFVLKYKELERKTKTATVTFTYTAYYQQERRNVSGDVILDAYGNPIMDWVPYSDSTSKTIDCAYWIPKGAALYKIDEGKVSNEAVDPNPIILTPNSGYSVELIYDENGGALSETTGRDWDYCSSYSEAASRVNSYDLEGALQRQIDKAGIKMGTLKVTGSMLDSGEYAILAGNVVKLKESLTWKPNEPSSAPLTNRDVLYRKDGIFAKIVQNQTYPTTCEVTYRLCATRGSVSPADIATRNPRANVVKIHTPVVNYTEIIPSEKDNGPRNTWTDSSRGANEQGLPTLVLGQEFTLKIPHNGQHITADGYNNNTYNYKGLHANGEESKWGSNNEHFAIKKQVKFTCGVIFVTSEGNKYYEKDKWIDLKNDQQEYKFIIPEWEEEKWKGDNKHIVTTRVIAENAKTVGFTDYTADSPSGITNTVDKYNKSNTQYIAEWKQKVNVIGEILDLEIRATNDPSWAGLKETLDLSKAPLGQPGQNQNTAYKYGIKLGYSAYFDVTTTGWYGDTSESIKITPKYYFVDAKGGQAREVDLYYKTSQSGQYLSLKNNPISLSTIMNQDVVRGKGYWSHFASKVITDWEHS